MLHGLRLKLTVIHIRAVIRLIGNGTDDQIRDLVQIRRLGDRRSLHLRTVGVKGIPDPVLFFTAVDKLIAAGHAAAEGLDIGIGPLAAPDGHLP